MRALARTHIGEQTARARLLQHAGVRVVRPPISLPGEDLVVLGQRGALVDVDDFQRWPLRCFSQISLTDWMAVTERADRLATYSVRT